ncbi:MAG: DUF2023 family protein [Candidatus Gastranaerophilales bacterium]|nr:DUF2023 family protein [Candidatus Gastranaerophilales bacterium]
MRISMISPYSLQTTNSNRPNIQRQNLVSFTQAPKMNPKKMAEISDLRVFTHHIYEFKKGIRNLILTTEKAKHKETIENRLQREKIDYVVHDISNDKINVYFGAKPCVDVVKTFNPKLNKLTPEQDFMLGIMLGYDRVKQCVRYLDFRKNKKLPSF